MENVILAIGWITVIFLGAAGVIILIKMITGTINLDRLISEPGDKPEASLSRFQFLIFTFVVAMSLLLVIVSKQPPGFPTGISPDVLALIGISGGSYLVSKGIQTSRDIGLKKEGEGGAPPEAAQKPPEGGGNPPPAA